MILRTKTAAAMVLLAALTFMAGCASGGERSASGNRNVITSEQIREHGNASAMEVIERLRPQFLQRRGTSTIANPENYPIVYVDNQRRGGLSELRQIPANVVDRIEFIPAADATTRWGTGHVAGVIMITTRR